MTSLTSEDRFCYTCKHLIGNRHNRDREESVSNWKCGHEENIAERKLNLVTGIKRTVYVREDIATVRCTHCEGKWYELYEEPKRIQEEPKIGGKEAKVIIPTEEVFAPADLQATKDAAAKRIEELKRKKLGLS